MNRLLQNPTRTLLIILIFYAVVSVVNLGGWGVVESSEARYAEISREMSQSRDWLHPTLMGIHHYHKPPVIYWITSLSYTIFGVNSFSARFFLMISLLLQMVLVYKIASVILNDKKIALYAVILYSSIPIVLVSVRGLSTDAYLNTFVLLTIFWWLQWRTLAKPVYLYLVAFSLGIAFLIKGPVAIIIPALVCIGFNGVISAKSFSMHHFFATIIFLVVASSWFVILVLENRDFIDYFLFRHTIERFSNAEVFTRKEPWWYYLVYGPLLALPWIMVIPFWLWTRMGELLLKLMKRISIFWVLIPLVFFSFSSSKLVLYILPLYAGLAIICGWCFSKLENNFLKNFEHTFLIFTSAIVLIVSIGSFFGLKNVSIWIQILPVTFITSILLIRYKVSYSRQRILMTSLFFSGFLILFSSFMMGQDQLKFNSTLPLTHWIKQNGLENKQIVVYDRLLPSLSFDLQKDIISISNGNRYLNREVQFEKVDTWKNSLFYLSKADDVERLRSILEKPSVMVAKGEVQQNALWLTARFGKKMKLDDWTIYYN